MNVTKKQPARKPSDQQEEWQRWIDEDLPQIVDEEVEHYHTENGSEVVLDKESLKKVQAELTKML